MQPPQIEMPMKHYIQTLRTASEQRLTEHRLNKHINQTVWEPLGTQIQRWWFNLPPVMQERKFQIVEIAAQCKGKYRDSPALRHVAAALRSCGWRESRDWTNQARNCRLWTPPEYFDHNH